ncbi:MAG: hypothetical protein M1831_005908 [Alyxoria varia]|nr:MAG: hypothetical protein M1831_005908 [Alyxoria varia]
MRLRRSPHAIGPVIISSLLLHQLATASPLSLDTNAAEQNSTLEKRCANPCGYFEQVCCGQGQTCYTDDNNQAQCGSGGQATAVATPASGGSGYWQYWTSFYVVTDTETKTQIYSSYVGHLSAQATETAAAAKCDWNQGESSCGNICCSQGEYCQVHGQCSGAASSYSAPLRPTSSGDSIVTQTSYSTTTTVPFGTPIATGQSAGLTAAEASGGGGLSGGAIAGIVIGVIIAIIILLLLCLIFCFRAAWNGLLAFFGLGKTRRRRETVEYESYHRSGRGGGGGGRTWYGAPRPRRTERTTTTTKKKSGGGPLVAGFGGLATALGFKKRQEDRKRRIRDEKSDYTSSYGTYSDYSYTASMIGGQGTREDRRGGDEILIRLEHSSGV